MGRNSFLIFVLLGMWLFTSVQIPLDEKKYSDSLTTALKSVASDSVKARTSYLLSDYWSSKDTVKSKAYLKLGIKLSGTSTYLKALSAFYAGSLYFDNQRDLAEKMYLRCDSLLSKFSTKEAYLFRARSWHNYGALRQFKDDYKTMTDVLLKKAIPFAFKAADTGYVGLNYSDVGLVFMNQWQYGKAEVYYNKAIQFLKNVPSRRQDLVNTYLCAVNNYLPQDKFKQAKICLDKAEVILKPYPTSEFNIDFYLAEGYYFRKIKRYNESLASLDKGVEIAKKLKKSYLLSGVLFQKYKTLTGLKQYEKAKEALLLVMDEKTMSFSQNDLMHYFELSETYYRLGNIPMAYKWLKKYGVIRDSVYVKGLTKDINQLEIKFRSAENEKKIAALEAEKQKAALKAENIKLSNWFLTITCFLLLIVAGFALFYYRNNKKLSQQKEINYQQKLIEVEQQQRLSVAKAVMEGEEKERTRVARDLHDGLGGMLAGVKLNLSGWAARHESQPQNVELHRIITQLDYSVHELRHIARNMMPETLLKFGLEVALQDLCESFMNNDIHVDFQPFGINKDIALTAQITIYRIAQELLANAVRHANATSVVLQCSQNDSVFFITVEDNGVGFDTKVLANKEGMGLNNIKNRIAYLKGKLDVISSPGEGTTINIELNIDV